MDSPSTWACTRLLVLTRNYEDAYSDPGSPASRRTAWGSYILATVDDGRQLLLQGQWHTTVPGAMYCLECLASAGACKAIQDSRGPAVWNFCRTGDFQR